MSKEAKRYSCGNGDGMIEDKNGFYVKYSQPTLFKVATEDSCVVLDEPKMEDYLIEKDSLKYDTIALECAIIEYDKAPLISQDRLELNKLRVESKTWERLSIDGGEELVKTHFKLTEANEQLNEYKEVVDKIKKIDRFEMEAGLGYNEGLVYEEKESEGTWIKFETVDELLSKLNKD